jgi:hypothetical protein
VKEEDFAIGNLRRLLEATSATPEVIQGYMEMMEASR